MEGEYTPTIGLEIHAELKTKTKMFCDSKNDSSETRPNVNICPVCLAHPGTLPVINGEAVRHVLKVGVALNSKLDATRAPLPAPPAATADANKPAVAAVVAAVTVKDLQGGEQKIVTPIGAPLSPRQLAQRANDRGQVAGRLESGADPRYPLAQA